MSIMSPHTGLPTRPTATFGPSRVPTLRGLRKWSRVFSLYWVDFMSGASRWNGGCARSGRRPGFVERAELAQTRDHARERGHDAVHVLRLAETAEGELQRAVRLLVQQAAG